MCKSWLLPEHLITLDYGNCYNFHHTLSPRAVYVHTRDRWTGGQYTTGRMGVREIERDREKESGAWVEKGMDGWRTSSLPHLLSSEISESLSRTRQLENPVKRIYCFSLECYKNTSSLHPCLWLESNLGENNDSLPCNSIGLLDFEKNGRLGILKKLKDTKHQNKAEANIPVYTWNIGYSVITNWL